MQNENQNNDVQLVEQLAGSVQSIKKEIAKVIIGQDEIVDHLLLSLLSRGHCLLVGVPGLAKTLIIKTLADVLDLKFNRIQFTPDLMPSDITGTEILEEDNITKKRDFRFILGPIFANVILADEINRTPPKTQAALLEAMQEHKVTIAGKTYSLDEPFFVLATQNPIEQEGTYPLPEAQLDRFMFNLWLDYPSLDEEKEIVKTTTGGFFPELNKIVSAETLISFQKLVRRVPVAENVISFAVNFVNKTRPNNEQAPQFIKDWLRWGAGPRASQYLILAAKAK
ncbi:MAG: AAA family ATPase, partial [Ignavibacteriaceae bacterium]|nr:AAA family ATPase [Ignavibacteriaceae bacterium]